MVDLGKTIFVQQVNLYGNTITLTDIISEGEYQGGGVYSDPVTNTINLKAFISQFEIAELNTSVLSTDLKLLIENGDFNLTKETKINFNNIDYSIVNIIKEGQVEDDFVLYQVQVRS